MSYVIVPAVGLFRQPTGDVGIFLGDRAIWGVLMAA
jgi:hypothetical protein